MPLPVPLTEMGTCLITESNQLHNLVLGEGLGLAQPEGIGIAGSRKPDGANDACSRSGDHALRLLG